MGHWLSVVAILNLALFTGPRLEAAPGVMMIGFAKSSASTWMTTGGFITTSAGYRTNLGGGVPGLRDGFFDDVNSIDIDVASDVMYVVDNDNERIVKLTASTGKFLGALGYSQGTTGTCPSAAGYTNGWCTGGTFRSAISPSFSNPGRIALDTANDYLYIVSVGDHSVRKYVASTGVYVGSIGRTSASTGTCLVGYVVAGWCTGGTFALGTGDGGFNAPSGIALDAVNDALYVSTTSNHKISKFVASTGAYVGSIGYASNSTGTCTQGVVATAWCTVGTSTGFFGSNATDGGFNFAGSLAVDPTGNFLYVADRSNHRIVKINANTGAFIGAIGKTSASTGTCSVGVNTAWCTGGTFISGAEDGAFNLPLYIALDLTNGKLHLYDSTNLRISRVIASTGAFDGSIGYLSASTGTCSASGASTTWCTGGTFVAGTADGALTSPRAIAFNATHLFLVNHAGTTIEKRTLSTGAFVGATGGYSSTGGWRQYTWPISGTTDGYLGASGDIATDATNNVYYLAQGARIMKFNLKTGAFVGAIGNVTASTGTCPASGVAPGWCTGGTFATGTGDGMYNATGIAVDSANGFLFIADKSNDRIVKVNASTGAFIGAIGRTSASSGTCSVGINLAWCTGGTFGTAAGSDGTYNDPESIEYDPTNGSLLVAFQPNDRIDKITASTGAYVGSIGRTTASTGTCPVGTTTGWCTGGTFGSGSSDGQFLNPNNIAIDPSNNVFYVGHDSVARVDKFTLDTGVYVGSVGQTTASSGTCPATGVATGWCTGGSFSSSSAYNIDGAWGQPGFIAINVAGDALYVSGGSGKLSKIRASTGAFIGAMGRLLGQGIPHQWITGGSYSSLGDIYGTNLGVTEGSFDDVVGMTFDPIHKTIYVLESTGRLSKRQD